MLNEIFDRYQIPPSVQKSLEKYLRDPYSISASARLQMNSIMSQYPLLFDECIAALNEEFQMAKKRIQGH
ncbi:MAG: hypothetical protein U0929_03885 [Planctomycetaceae bacterium]